MNGSFGYESVTFPAGAMATTNVHNTVVYDELSGKYYKTLSIDTSDPINQMWVKRYNEMHPLMDSADGSIKGSGFPALTKVTGETIRILVPLDGYVNAGHFDISIQRNKNMYRFTRYFRERRKPRPFY